MTESGEVVGLKKIKTMLYIIPILLILCFYIRREFKKYEKLYRLHEEADKKCTKYLNSKRYTIDQICEYNPGLSSVYAENNTESLMHQDRLMKTQKGRSLLKEKQLTLINIFLFRKKSIFFNLYGYQKAEIITMLKYIEDPDLIQKISILFIK